MKTIDERDFQKATKEKQTETEKSKGNRRAIFKTRIWLMRTRIRRMRRTGRTLRIRRTRRIWRIRRIRRIQQIRIFKRFLSFIYSPTKGFISSSKLSCELYLAEGWTTNKCEAKILTVCILRTYSMEYLVIVYFSF